ncbi:tyrosine-type recombinase/integrase [Mesorhizobium abyssinicae]|uniref:tyrosine-type recombinase/integrase n=1 Tax=Mesorhizobium abyssinicae TaxID=1209958 RepID=UPI002A24830A|nr:tyrosine-type recombinase/integrase [Mesorhizobium abyssinicae]MDX8437280.1 tyrosine-type recombinase/integrase [Mesorhizobium abyssinicae]
MRRRPLGQSWQAGEGAERHIARRVSPHSIRHTTATHLLRAGVDINTVRGWLGHVLAGHHERLCSGRLRDQGSGARKMRGAESRQDPKTMA